MDSKMIDTLLEKYWNCETSLEEEEEIRLHFTANEAGGKLNEVGELFRYFDLEKKKEMDTSFDAKLLNKLGDAQPEGSRQVWMKPWLTQITRIAAIIIVGLSIVFIIQKNWSTENKEARADAVASSLLEKDTYEDPQKAYEETVKALRLISAQLNEGKRQTMKLAVFNEAEETVKESMIN